MKPVDLFVIGAAKSGTTWVDRNLRSCEGVDLPLYKETQFFCGRKKRNIGWYNSLFNHRNLFRCEVDPAYMVSRDAIDSIYAHNPDAKIVAILRNPLHRAYSHFSMVCRGTGNCDQRSLVCPGSRILDDGLYAYWLSKWFEFFPRENVKIFFYEHVFEEPKAIFNSLSRFVGIDFSPSSDMNEEIHGARPYPKYPAAYRGAVRAAKVLKKNRLGISIFQALKNVGFVESLHNWNNGGAPPKFTEDTINLLRRHYNVELDQLERLLGENLSSWRRSLESGW